MEARFLCESLQIRNNDQYVIDLLKSYKGIPHGFGMNFDLSDGKPGKYFVSGELKNAFDRLFRILCFSYSKKFILKHPSAHGFHSFYRDYVYIVTLYDDDSSGGDIGGSHIGEEVDASDMMARKMSSTFVRDTVRKLSRYDNPVVMYHKLMDIYTKNIGNVWGK